MTRKEFIKASSFAALGIALIGCTEKTGMPNSIKNENIADSTLSYPSASSEKQEDLLLYAFPVGEAANIDLDGDEIEEVITYKADGDDETPVDEFTVNGIDFLSVLQSEDSYVFFPDLKNYYVVDLDTADGVKEIAIQDDGPSDDPSTYFFRWNNGNLIYIGMIPSHIADNATTIYGSGSFVAPCRLGILQTWLAPMNFKLEDDKIVKEEQELYSPIYYECSEQTVTLIQDVKVFSDKSLDTELGIWKANNTPITFTATDNSEWVQMQRDTLSAWIHVTDFCNVDDAEGNPVMATEIFNGLCMAD